MVKVHLKNCLDRYIPFHSDNFIFLRYLMCISVYLVLAILDKENFTIHLQTALSDFEIYHLSCIFCIFFFN